VLVSAADRVAGRRSRTWCGMRRPGSSLSKMWPQR